ncbi:MAG: 4Fe-4S binding protein [Candidatus Scatosoma sp.]
MEKTEIFDFLQKQIHTVIVATNNEQGLPVTCAIDIMDYDENGLYFLTAKGKNFYKRLKANGYLSLTGIRGNNTMSCIAVSVCGKVKEIGSERLQRLLDKNPYMYEIYPTEQSRSALTVFYLYEGNGEWFDLSEKPIERFPFSFGESRAETVGYFVTDDCIGCGKCFSVCPQSCIVFNGKKAFITQGNCLHCGNCADICHTKAIVIK